MPGQELPTPTCPCTGKQEALNTRPSAAHLGSSWTCRGGRPLSGGALQRPSPSCYGRTRCRARVRWFWTAHPTWRLRAALSIVQRGVAILGVAGPQGSGMSREGPPLLGTAVAEAPRMGALRLGRPVCALAVPLAAATVLEKTRVTAVHECRMASCLKDFLAWCGQLKHPIDAAWEDGRSMASLLAH